LSPIDPPEAADPFYVPSRTDERISFIGAIAMAVTPAVFLFLMPADRVEIWASLTMFVLAALSLLRGLQSRAHRMKRVRAVAALYDGARRHAQDLEFR